MYSIVGEHFYNDRVDLKLENQDEVKPVLEKIKLFTSLGTWQIKRTDTKDGVKLYLNDDSSWILVRPSGTEPLLRIYFESNSHKKIDELKQLIVNNL